jgi:EAL domain-containing protein (putative c-di-GMP-specific phosphodiesterase class I)
LQRLSIDTLKIDRAFFEAGAHNRAIVRAVTALAQALGMTVTAEGLETAEQVAWAQAAGCDRGPAHSPNAEPANTISSSREVQS